MPLLMDEPTDLRDMAELGVFAGRAANRPAAQFFRSETDAEIRSDRRRRLLLADDYLHHSRRDVVVADNGALFSMRSICLVGRRGIALSS